MRFPVIAALAAGLSLTAASAEITLSEQPLSFGQQVILQSSVYGTEREINIYAPEKPEWIEEALPVVFVIDGGAEQDFFHIAGLSQLTLVNGERMPMIVVGVRTHERRQEIVFEPESVRYQKEFPEEWGGSDRFLRFLTDEVVPLIEERYETGRKALMGESLAGLFVMDAFLRAPESFDDFVSVSPSLWWDDRRLAREADGLLENYAGTDKRLYVTMANEGGTMQLGLDEVLAALAEHQPEGVTYQYVDRREGKTHATIYHGAARDAFFWLYGLPPYPEGELPWYLDPAESSAD